MPATKKLEPTSKDSVMRTPQIAIHNSISFCIKLVTQVKKNFKNTKIWTFDLKF